MSTSISVKSASIKPFWSPLLAGIALGIVLMATFIISGHGLGASGAATHAIAGAGLVVATEATKANSYLGPMVSEGSPMGSWITWEVLGIGIGAAVSAFMAGRFRVQMDGGKKVGNARRVSKALLGGMLAGFGARIAGGCTSGLGLSGAATLGISAFVFLALFFAVGLIVSRFVRGV